MNLYVSSLSFNVRSEDLKELFSQFGEVKSANVINDKETGRSRGFGFVEMADSDSGQKAIQGLDNSQFDGRNIGVQEARPREDRGGRTEFRSDNRSGGFKKKW
jgi:RNA recognition motif-containing protein